MYGQVQDPLVHAAAALAQSTTAEPIVGSRDTMFTKIFVGGLPYHTSDKTLHEYFEQFGDIEEAVVITDRNTQKSRGYGFVTMKDKASADRACKDPNPIIDGRKANVNLAYLGAKPRTNVQLAALAAGQVQLPLTTQLQALFPPRIGLPQMYYPAVTGFNPLIATQGAAAQQQLIDYSALAAVMGQNPQAAAYGLPSQGKCKLNIFKFFENLYNQYAAAYPAGYGLVPQAAYNLGSSQLQLAAAQQQLEHQRV
ncbi:Protein CBR-SUP-12 [Caenorhabditis briggsae]|uniref:Protein CBR-SUP-12 n=1 Tax=Caenorhabditis briggsae TaxID=6238 RepID=A8XJQ8_CAEBR|nr:Protein CBR-SUP-12 [Caenorhabditis briggsae]CAP32884.2 Protein CBR-SUP-12 [Caenorhabditis briggsae]